MSKLYEILHGIIDKVNNIPSAISNALQQAKDSGEFKGDKGDTGAPGLAGKDGEDGDSGVYFGKEEPTDENVNVWIRDTDNSDNVLNFVSYTPQTLTHEQQAQARENIGACDNIRPRVELSDSVVTLEPNQFYVFPEMASLSITFGGEADSGAVQEYQFRFISGAVATTLILPEAVKGDITVDANSVVEVSVVDNYAISQSWAVN